MQRPVTRATRHPAPLRWPVVLAAMAWTTLAGAQTPPADPSPDSVELRRAQTEPLKYPLPPIDPKISHQYSTK